MNPEARNVLINQQDHGDSQEWRKGGLQARGYVKHVPGMLTRSYGGQSHG